MIFCSRRNAFIHGVVVSLLCWCGGAAAAASPSPPGEPMISIKDLTPKFLGFYEAAKKERASPDRR